MSRAPAKRTGPTTRSEAPCKTYRVKQGDTLGSIARQLYGEARRYPLIVSANTIPDPDRLKVGQELVIPDAELAGRGAVAASSVSHPAPAAAGGRAAALNDRRLSQVHPGLAARARAMIDLCDHAGIAILVSQATRTWEEQDALFAKGRTVEPIGKPHIVTKARGGQSYHNFGLAFDIVVLDAMGKADWDDAHPGWRIAAELGKSVGLAWGGDWKGFKDLPHFEYTAGLSLVECRALYPSGLGAIWDKVT